MAKKNEPSPEYLRRLREITEVLSRHEIVKGITPDKLVLILQDLGPTYIKLGQIMSMRSDILPKEYCKALEKLRSEVAPMDFGAVRQILENAYGCPMEQVFLSFEETPLGSASIAQAHKAVLQTGEEVVVKVQRQGIYETMSRDMALLRRAVKLLKYTGTSELVDFGMVLDEMWAAAQQEMNFFTEAENLEEFRRLNQEVVFIACPALYREYTSHQVLVMEYIGGLNVDENEGLCQAGYDLTEIGAKIADNYIKQVVEDGFFHADPHPGNIKIRDGKIVWIDMGMMGRISSRDQALIGSLVEGVARNDITLVKDVVMSLGVFQGKIDQRRLYEDIDELLAKYGSADLGGMDLAKVMEDLMDVMKRNEISMPHGLSMLARGLATLEGVVAGLSPEISIVSIASGRIAGRMLKEYDWKKELKRSAQAVYESSKKALDIPALVSDLLRSAIKGQASFNIDLHPSDTLASLLRETACLLAGSLLAAALVTGSSILCAADISPKLMGIPALAFAGYLAAAALSLALWLHRRKK